MRASLVADLGLCTHQGGRATCSATLCGPGSGLCAQRRPGRPQRRGGAGGRERGGVRWRRSRCRSSSRILVVRSLCNIGSPRHGGTVGYGRAGGSAPVGATVPGWDQRRGPGARRQAPEPAGVTDGGRSPGVSRRCASRPAGPDSVARRAQPTLAVAIVPAARRCGVIAVPHTEGAWRRSVERNARNVIIVGATSSSPGPAGCRCGRGSACRAGRRRSSD